MEVIGTILSPIQGDDSVDMAEMQRLGLDKQYTRFAVGHKDETTDDYPIYLFGEGLLMLNFGQRTGSVLLDRQEVTKLYTFFSMPHVKELIVPIIRASLIESGCGALVDQLLAMPDEMQQGILWAFGRADKPAFLDATQ